MQPSIQPFGRLFTQEDLGVFEALTTGIAGPACRRVGHLYGGAFSLHFGEMRPSATPKGRERGTWIVTAWGCDAHYRNGAALLDDKSPGRERLIDTLKGLVGVAIQEISVDPDQVSLHLTFTNDSALSLIPDSTFDGDAWTIASPLMQTLAANAARVWSLENEGETHNG
jgi:hypothetical protein